MCEERNPIQCIIPEYMVEKMLESKISEIRRAALEGLQRDAFIRNQRTLMGTPGILATLFDDPGVEAHNADLVREVYSANNTENLPGKLVHSEGDKPTKDAAVNEAFDGSGDTWNFYRDVHGRNSINDNGMILKSTVHYGQNYDNAFWNGAQMAYGDGSGTLFNRMTASLDVIGHELTHGVVQHEGGLNYQFQSGALNESFADVFGSMVKQYKLKQDVQSADWTVGKEIIAQEEGTDWALRSLKNPGAAYKGHPVLGDDPQPATMDDYVNLPIWRDRGGVHINSGIPNHAFYLTAMKFKGYAWEKAGKIWYNALRGNKLGFNASFSKAAEVTIEQAFRLFGSDGEKKVTEAWREVKVIS